MLCPLSLLELLVIAGMQTAYDHTHVLVPRYMQTSICVEETQLTVRSLD